MIIIDLIICLNCLTFQIVYREAYIHESLSPKNATEMTASIQSPKKYDYFEILLDDNNPIILRSIEKCGTAYTFDVVTGETYFVSCSQIKRGKPLKDMTAGIRQIRWSKLSDQSKLTISGQVGKQIVFDIYSDIDLTKLTGRFVLREVVINKLAYHLACYIPNEAVNDIESVFKVMETFKIIKR